MTESSSSDGDRHHHHHHHHHHGRMHGWRAFSIYMDCGLQHFWRGKRHAKWLKELFAEKDDVSWLKGLFEQKEISEEQFAWLRDLFAKKSEHDQSEANKWWQNVANGNKFGENFDPDSMPDWLKEASKREKAGNWSWNSKHGKKEGHHVHKSSWKWSSKDGEKVPASDKEAKHEHHSHSTSHSHSRSWSWSSKHDGEAPADEQSESQRGHWSKKWKEVAEKANTHFEEAKEKAADLSEATRETPGHFIKDALNKFDLGQKLHGGQQSSDKVDEPLLI